MMAYQIRWMPQAIKDITSLEPTIQERIIDKLEIISVSPTRSLDYIKQYGVHRLRVGDYRIFIDLHNRERSLDVLTIRHRKKAYKRS